MTEALIPNRLAGWKRGAIVTLVGFALTAYSANVADAGGDGVPAVPAGIGPAASRLAPVQNSVSNSTLKIEMLEDNLDRIDVPTQAREDLLQQIKEKERELAELKTKVESLKAGLKEPDGAAGTEPVDRLRVRLADLEALAAKLKQAKEAAEAELARASAVSTNPTQKAGLARIQWSNRKPVHVVLIGKRVVPLDEPYYQLEWTTNYFGSSWRAYVSKATRVRDGEPVEEALDAGGCFAQQLEKTSTNTHKVQFWVCPDAVPTYRLMAEAVKKKGYTIFWIPHDDKPITVSGSGGGNNRGPEEPPR
jgi:TolA-binding protein